MLYPCTKEAFDRHVDFAYALASDLTKSGYPTYCDGIKTKAMFVERSLKAFARRTEQMLLFVCEGTVQGLIHCYWLPEDHYLGTVSFLIQNGMEQALSEFLAWARENFRGYDLFLGFPAENQAAVQFLADHGFACIEDDCNNTAFLDRCGEIPKVGGLVQIGKENYESFRSLHRKTEGDMYWNSDRILEDLESWTILVKEEGGQPQGAIYYRACGDKWFEIFGIDRRDDAHDSELLQALLYGALQSAKDRGGRVMTFFCDKEDEEKVKECGFVCVGNHLCYTIRLE